MTRKSRILKTISAAVASIFLLQQVVWAAGDTPAEAAGTICPASSSQKAPLGISMPSELVQVDEARSGENGETIISIQDSHTSLSAQYSIVKVLDELTKNYDLELVSIEGGEGYIDTSILKSHPDSSTRERTAAYLMKEGRISAGEFFSAMSDGNVALYGAEDNALYLENLKCFRDIYAENRQNIAILSSLLAELRKAEDRVYSRELSALTYKSRLHRSGKISFDVYWSFISGMCRNKGIAVDGYTDIKSYESSAKLEKNIDFKEATRERGALLDKLMKGASREELEEMVLKSMDFEKGKIDQYGFHRWLLSVAAVRGIDPREYKELAKYGNYVSDYNSLNVIGLQRELDDAEARLLEKLFSSAKERRLYRIVRTTELLEALFEIKLMNGEVPLVKENLNNVSAEDFSEFIGADVPAGFEKGLPGVLNEAKKALKFYEIAEERSKAMIANTVEAMRREGKKVAVLISGGHHSEGLTEIMKEKGLSYLVLMPKYTEEKTRPYVAVLTKKSGPYRELAGKGAYDLAIESYFNTGDASNLEEMIAFAVGQSALTGKDPKAEAKKWADSYESFYKEIPDLRKQAMTRGAVSPGDFEAKLAGITVVRKDESVCEVQMSGKTYIVKADSVRILETPSAKAAPGRGGVTDLSAVKMMVRYLSDIAARVRVKVDLKWLTRENYTLSAGKGADVPAYLHPFSYIGAKILGQKLFKTGNVLGLFGIGGFAVGVFFESGIVIMAFIMVLVASLYLAFSSGTYTRLAESTWLVFREQGFTEEEIVNTPIARREQLADRVVRTEAAFNRLSPWARERIIFHESFDSHGVGMLMLMPGLYLIGRLIRRTAIKSVVTTKQSDFSNLAAYVRNLEDALGREREEALWAVSQFAGNLPLRKQYVPGGARGNIIAAIMGRKSFNNPEMSEVSRPSGLSQGKSIKGWLFTAERKKNLPIHVDVTRLTTAVQGAMDRGYYRDALEMLSHLSGDRILWTNEMSADPGQKLHFHFFNTLEPLPIESYGSQPIVVSRKGQPVISKLKAYPDAKEPISVYAVKGSVATPADIELLSARCYDVESIIRSNRYSVTDVVAADAVAGKYSADKVFVAGDNGTVTVYFFPRTKGHARFFPSDREPRMVGPLAMSGHWILDGVDEHGQFTLTHVRRILAEVALPVNHPSSAKIDSEIVRNFEEVEGTGVMPPGVTYRVFDGIEPGAGFGGDLEEFVFRQKRIIDTMWEGGVRRLNYALGLSEAAMRDDSRWTVTMELLKYASEKGMTTVLSLKSLVNVMDRLDGRWPQIEKNILPYVNEISFQVQEMSPGLDRVIDVFLSRCAGKTLEVYTCVNESNKFNVILIGEYLKEKLGREMERVEWEVSRERNAAGDYSVAESDYNNLLESMSRHFEGARVKYAVYSRDEAELYIDSMGKMTAPVAGGGWSADLLDEATVRASGNRQVFKTVTDNSRRQSSFFPKRDVTAADAQERASAESAGDLLPSVKKLLHPDLKKHVSAEEQIAVAIASKMGFKDRDLSALRLAVWGHHVGENPRLEYHGEYENMRAFLQKAYPGAKAANDQWHAFVAIEEMLADKGEGKTHEEKFDIFCREMARLMDITVLSPAQKEVARSLFDFKGYALRTIRGSKIQLPEETQWLMAYYGEYGRLKNVIRTDPDYLKIFMNKSISPEEMAKLVAAVRVARIITNKNDSKFQGLRGDTVDSMWQCLKFTLGNLKANGEYDDVSGAVVSAFLTLLREDNDDMTKAIRSLRSEGSISAEAEDEIFKGFLRRTFDFVIDNPENVEKLFDKYAKGPVLKDYSRWADFLAGLAFFGVIATSAVGYFLWFGTAFAVSLSALSYLIVAALGYRSAKGKIESAMKIVWGSEGKDIRTIPIVKILPDGRIDKRDAKTKALLDHLKDNAPAALRYVESLESFWGVNWAMAANLPGLGTIFNTQTSLTVRQNYRLDKIVSSLKAVTAYSSLNYVKMNERRKELDYVGGKWQWKRGDGIALVAFAGEQLQGEITALQEKLRKIVSSEEKLHLTEPAKLHMTVGTVLPNTLAVTEDIAEKRKEWVEKTRKIADEENAGSIGVNFNIGEVTIARDGSILMLGRADNMKVEKVRDRLEDVAADATPGKDLRTDILHITIGRIFDEKMSPDVYNKLREVILDYQKTNRKKVPLTPQIGVWDQAMEGNFKYRQVRPDLPLPGVVPGPAAGGAPRDLSGLISPSSNPVIEQLIRDGKMVEIFLEHGSLVARKVKWVEGYKPGQASSSRYLGDEVDVATIFNPEQVRRMADWMKERKLDGDRGNVRFRIALDEAALGWRNDEEHSNISHAGWRDGAIYIGERMLAKLFDGTNQAERKMILDEDEYRHLIDQDFNCRVDEEAYIRRLMTAGVMINGIMCEPPGRYGFTVCSNNFEAVRRHPGIDRYDSRIRWGNFTLDKRHYDIENMAPVPMAGGLYIEKSCGVKPSDLRMKIWMGQDDNYYRWSDKNMQLVYSNPVDGGDVYYFAGEVPAFFQGEFTFKYSVDGGKTWRWANNGAGDNTEITRKMLHESMAEQGSYGLWRDGEKGPAYKRVKVITLYDGGANLKALVDKALPVEDDLWKEWGMDPTQCKRCKVLQDVIALDMNRAKEGRLLVLYDEEKNKIVVKMEGVYPGEKVYGTEKTYGELGWFKSEIEIPLDVNGAAKGVIHRRGLMGMSRSGMALLLAHAGLTEGRFETFYRLLQEELVLYPVEKESSLKEMYDTQVIEVVPMAAIMGDENFTVTEEDITKIENVIKFARSRVLTRMALGCLEILANKGMYGKDLYRENERYVIEKMALEGMAGIERQIRQDRALLKSMGIDKGEVKSVAIRWFTSDANKSVYRVTFRMKDRTAKVFAMEFMNPVFLGQNFVRTNIEQEINLWAKISDKGADLVPQVFAVARVNDYKPKILDTPLPGTWDRGASEFTIDPSVIDPRRVVYDDALIVARAFIEGRELLDYKAYARTNPEEERRVYRAGLKAYFQLWKSTMDPATGRGAGLLDPSPRNVVVFMSGQGYQGVVSELESLRQGITLMGLMRALAAAGYSKGDVLDAAKGVLNDNECKTLEDDYDAAAVMGWSGQMPEEVKFMRSVGEAPKETMGNIAETVSRLDFDNAVVKLTPEEQRIATHSIKVAISYIEEKVNRNTELSPEVKGRIGLAIDQMRRGEIWSKVRYYKARYAHGFMSEPAMPVFEMLYAFKSEDLFYLAEGFLKGTAVAREESVAAVLLGNIMSEIITEGGNAAVEDGVKMVLGEDYWTFRSSMSKYATKSYLKCVLEDDVLGIGPNKDIVSYQGLKNSPEDRREAAKNAEEYLETVYGIVSSETAGISFSGREELAGYLTRRFGVRKFIIAGGKGTRFSPDGISVKQLFMPDNQSTNTKLSRISAAFGKFDDVVVVDTVTAFNVMKKGVPISNGVKQKMMDNVRGILHELIDSDSMTREEAVVMLRDVHNRIRSELKETKRDDGLMDLGIMARSVNDAVRAAVGFSDQRVQFFSDKIVYGIFKAVLSEEGNIDEEKKDNLLGKNCTIMLDSGDGHGSAYMEALNELDSAGKLAEARYSIIMHADSPGWGLDKYPNSVFITYLKTVNMFSPEVGELPKVVIAAKNPMDGRAKGRARIYVDRSGKYGPVPTRIMEWNEMTEDQQAEALRMAGTRDADFMTNANILICDTAWAAGKAGVMKSDYKHVLGKESKKKRRAYEYWSSDLVNIGAREYEAAQTPEEEISPVAKIVHLGQFAPNANKTLRYALEYRNDLQEMLLDKIRAQGVDVDKSVTVSISGKDIGPGYDWDAVVERIFGDNLNKGTDNLGNSRIRGSIHLDETVKIGRGAVLDGTKHDIWLTGDTKVARGVELQGVVAHDEVISRDRLYKEDKIIITGFPRKGSRTMEATLVRGVSFTELGLITDERTKVWLIKNDKSISEKEALLRIFGSDSDDGVRVLDQIFLYGDVILEDTVRVENGTMLDGRSSEVTLLGKTAVRKGTVLKSVKAKDTTFASRRGLDVYRYKQLTSIKEDFWLFGSTFENSFVEWGAVVQLSTVLNSCVMHRAKVIDSDVTNDIVTSDSPVIGQRVEDKEKLLSSIIAVERESDGSVKYVPGAFLLEEYPEKKDRDDVKNYQFHAAQRIYRMFISSPAVLDRMDEDTQRFIYSPSTDSLTLQQMREYFFAKVRENCLKYTGKVPSFREFRTMTDEMRAYAGDFMEKVNEMSGPESPGVRELFREVTLLSARFNLFDPSMDDKLLDVIKMAKEAGESRGQLQRILDEKTETRPAIDALDRFEEMVFSGERGTFLFLPDNIGETEADAVLWALLIKMGHKVVVAPRGGFAFGDIDVEGVREIIASYDAPGGLKDDEAAGRIKVIDSGSLGEGVMPHKITAAMSEVMSDPSLKAIISKGQANIFTLSARNRIKAAMVVLFLCKSRTSAKITGIPLRKGKFWPIVAVLDKDESGASMRVLNHGGKSQFYGSLKRFGTVDKAAEEGHAFSAKASTELGRIILYSSLAAAGAILAGNYLALDYMPVWFSYASGGILFFFALASLRYFLLARDTYQAMLKYTFQGRAPDDTLEDDRESLEQAKSTDIAFREGSGIIRYHPAFRELDSTFYLLGIRVIGPERAQELIRAHESFRSHVWGMFAIFPVFGVGLRYLHRRIFPQQYMGAEMAIHSDLSNMSEILETQVRTNIERGFLPEAYLKPFPEETIDGNPLLRTTIDRSFNVTARFFKKSLAGQPEQCNFCQKPVWSNEAPRSKTDDWVFSVDPSPGFAKQVVAISARHVPQTATGTEYYYDALKMMHRLKKDKQPGAAGAVRRWQISWPCVFSTNSPGHMHFTLFLREGRAPVEDYETVPVWVDRKGHGVVYSVRAYPDKENAVAAYMIKGRVDSGFSLFAKRCADLENIIKTAGYEADKVITKDDSGLIKVFFFPRTGPVVRYSRDGVRKLLGPVDMSGVWTVPEERLPAAPFTLKDVHMALRSGALSCYSAGFQDIIAGIERHFSEAEGNGLFPSSMDMMVTTKCNLNCPVCWGAYTPEFRSVGIEKQKKMIDVMYANGMRRMVFTGGEPLIEPGLVELLKYAKTKGVTTWLFTNGILMTEERADEIMPYVDMISLSLDGYDDATNSVNRSTGHFDAVMRVLDIMKRRYPNKDVQILTVVTNRNKDMVRKIGGLLRRVTPGLNRFQWKLNYYKRIGRSHEEVEVKKDPYLMSYPDFEKLAVSVQREFGKLSEEEESQGLKKIKVRYSPPEHDKAYLFVFPDGTLATTVHADYLKLGNLLYPESLRKKENVLIYNEIAGNISNRAIIIPKKGTYAAPDFKRHNIMGQDGLRTMKSVLDVLDDDIVQHTHRVTALASILAAKLAEKSPEIDDHYRAVLRAAALAHDLGAQEKYDPQLQDALRRINAGIHKHSDERVEPTTICLFEWGLSKALKNKRIPRDELMSAFAIARQENDNYPMYRLYLKYVVLELAPGEDLSNEEERVARNLFSHGRSSVEVLKRKGIEFPTEVGLLVEYHHDYNALDGRLKEMVAEGAMDQRNADMIRLLSTVIIVADVVEAGSNYKRRVEQKNAEIEDLGSLMDDFNGFIWKRFNRTERIPDKRAIEALKSLISERRSGEYGLNRMSMALGAILGGARRAPESSDWMTEPDKRMQARIARQRLIEAAAGYQAQGESFPKVVIGIPSSIYKKLSRTDLEDLRDSKLLSALIPLEDSGDREAMLKELDEKTRGEVSVAGLIDPSAVDEGASGEEIVKELFPVIEDFALKARRDFSRIAGAGARSPYLQAPVDLSPDGVRAIKDISGISKIMDTLIRAIPDCRSYRMVEKSVRQMRMEKSYYEYYGNKPAYSGRMEYISDVVNDTKTRYLVHFADISDAIDGKGALVIPPGLEIQKRRETQKVDRRIDTYKDKFFIVAPRAGMSVCEKDRFRKRVMDIWMLHGVVSVSDVVILDRKENAYTASELYNEARKTYEGVGVDNAGFRVLAGKLEYDTSAAAKEMLMLELGEGASTNMNQYEVFVNLMVFGDESYDEYKVDGLKQSVGGRHYIYMPSAMPVNIETEMRSYYERYVREVMVRA